MNFAAPIFLSSKAKNSRLFSEMGVLVQKEYWAEIISSRGRR